MSRADDIDRNLTAVRRRVAAACARVGRDPATITLIAVTKTFPASDVRILASLGVRDIGENRDDEAATKAAELSDLDVCWHFVGQLQSNKCRSVARYAAVVHSVDRQRLVAALSRAAVAAGRSIDVFVQVDLDPPGAHAGRGGTPPESALELADLVSGTEALRLVGVMGIAPPGGSAVAAFTQLAVVAATVRASHPAAAAISAGMSGDLEEAVAAGATHLRVGTALLGDRVPLLG